MAEKIDVIKEELKNAPYEALDLVIAKYAGDERVGVQKLLEQAKRRKETYLAECARLDLMLSYEWKYMDFPIVCGVDEAGRGPFAGPVVAAAVVLPKGCKIMYLNDSKQLSEKKREELFPEILDKAYAYGIGSADHETIDKVNILQATYIAMREALKNMADMCGAPDVLLNDAVTIPGVDELFPEKSGSILQVPIIKGDAKSLSIAAASVLAKVTRDHMMIEFDKLYPGYNFAKNKGYGGCAQHRDKLKADGPCPIHRKTFLKNYL